MAAKVKQPIIDDNLDLDKDLKAERMEPDKEKKPKREKARRKMNKAIVPILLGLFIVGGLSALLVFNIFSVRSRFITPILQRIPIVNNLVPASGAQTGDPFANATRDELVAQIKAQQAEIDTLTSEQTDLLNKKDTDMRELERLQNIEAQHLQFIEDKRVFDEMVARNDPAAYSSFYASVSPENAEILYKEAVTTVQQTKDFKKYINTVQAMEEADAAKMLEQLVATDMNLVVLILNNIDSEHSGAILTAMDPKVAASIVKQMVPVQQ